MLVFYHATDYENLASILDNGLRASIEGIVYLTETEQDALKMVALRGYKEILTIKILIPEKEAHRIVETFDHSEAFFKCKSYGYQGNISKRRLTPLKRYDNPYYFEG